jgi:hypothetical protein
MGSTTDSGGQSERTDQPAELDTQPEHGRLRLASVGPRELSPGSTLADEAGSVWMTKAELARVRRISVASADRLIRRQGWRRQPGNDGRVRVLVPPSWASKSQSNPTDTEPPDPTDRIEDPTDTSSEISLLEATVAALREQQDHERAGWAEERLRRIVIIDGLRDRADRADVALSAERVRADALRERLDAAQGHIAAAQGQLAAAEDAARLAHAEAQAALDVAARLREAVAADRARGRLRRVLAALRGQ